jgi:hypothetical protein
LPALPTNPTDEMEIRKRNITNNEAPAAGRYCREGAGARCIEGDCQRTCCLRGSHAARSFCQCVRANRPPGTGGPRGGSLRRLRRGRGTRRQRCGLPDFADAVAVVHIWRNVGPPRPHSRLVGARQGSLAGYGPSDRVRTAYKEVCVRMKRVRRSFPPKTRSSGRSGTGIVSISLPEELYTKTCPAAR